MEIYILPFFFNKKNIIYQDSKNLNLEYNLNSVNINMYVCMYIKIVMCNIYVCMYVCPHSNALYFFSLFFFGHLSPLYALVKVLKTRPNRPVQSVESRFGG